MFILWIRKRKNIFNLESKSRALVPATQTIIFLEKYFLQHSINFIRLVLTPQQIAHAWFDAFNTHDIEMLLALYAEDAEHYSPKLKIRQPETNGLIKGKPALRA